MEWLNIHTSTLDSVAFLGSEPADHSIWLKLLRYCIGQENGGVIEKAAKWKPHLWQNLVRLTVEQVHLESKLWEWDGDDLLVKFYPFDQEGEVRAKRRAGRMTQAKLRAKQKAKHEGQHEAEQAAKQETQQAAKHEAEQSTKVMEGKEREDKSKGMVAHTHTNRNRPSLEEALEYFSRLGADYRPEEVREGWLTFEANSVDEQWFFGRRPVGDWRAALETRLADLRRRNTPAPAPGEHPAGWVEGDEAEWWSWPVELVESAAAGAWIAGEKVKAARLDAIVARRKGGR